MGKFIVNRNRLLFLTSLILFRIIMDLSYIYAVVPVFSYSGFELNIDYIKLIESYLFTVLLALPLNYKISKPSNMLLLILFLAVMVPNLSFYTLNSKERIFMYYIMLGYLIVVITANLFPRIKFPLFKQGRSFMIGISIISVMTVLALMVKNGGLRYLNFDLTKVYDYRREVSYAINVGFLGYLNTWAFKVINPALIVWALFRRKIFWLGAFVFLQVIFFAISSHKSVLFYPFMIVGLYFLFNKFDYKKISSWLVFSLVFFIIVCVLAEIIWGYILPVSLFVRRVFYVPAMLNFAYYEVFSQLGHVYLSNSIFSLVVDYPFAYDYTRIISLYLLGHPETECNNGFLATSFMHFGLGGVIVYSFIVGILIWLVDSLSYNKMPVWVSISIVVVPFFSLFTSADLTTALLTHGIVLSLFLLWFFRKKQCRKGVRK